ncbi:helicase [Paramecium bursaria Chlorella virus KS1B]|nr:helicase [Paramecium bursaria Chlorella virus KS1B]
MEIEFKRIYETVKHIKVENLYELEMSVLSKIPQAVRQDFKAFIDNNFTDTTSKDPIYTYKKEIPWGNLTNFLSTRYAKDGDVPDDHYRIQRFPGVYRGFSGTPKYHIHKDDYSLFLELFAEVVKQGEHPPLMEYRKQNGVYPVVADFDFRQTSTTRLFDEAFSHKVAKMLSVSICKFVDVDAPEYFILNKPLRTGGGGEIRDGFHIHFPDVAVKTDIARMIYENFVDSNRKDEYIPEGITNGDKAYDYASYKNAWFLYGAKKPNEPYPWAIDEPFSTELVKKFSLQGKPEREYRVVIPEYTSPPRVETSSLPVYTKEDFCGDEVFSKLLRIIKTRSHNYDEWFETLCAIYNVGQDYGFDPRDFAHEFSRYDTEKYNPKSVDDKLAEASKRTGKRLTFGSIVYWARQINKDKTDVLITKQKTSINPFINPFINVNNITQRKKSTRNNIIQDLFKNII